MARVRVELPALLTELLRCEPTVSVDASTLAGVLDGLERPCPGISLHLFSAPGKLREHVLCFLNDDNSRWLPSLDVPVADGDRVVIMQAVSGG